MLGDSAPPAGARLPGLSDAPAPKRPAEPTARAPRRPAEPPKKAARAPKRTPRKAPPLRRRAPPVDWMILVDAGQVVLPDAVLRMATYEGFASIRGVSLDVSAFRVAGERHGFGGRLGVTIPTIASRNWWPRGSRASYIDIDAVFIDAAFAYAYWRPLVGRLSWLFRAELGASFVAGEVRRIATLPTCPAGAEAICPHWRVAGDLGDPLPSRVYPALRLTTGLAFEIAGGLHVRAEVGLRDLPWWGVGFGLRR